METHLTQELRDVLTRFANAVLPLEAWLADPNKKPPPAVALIPRVAKLPWRPENGAALLSIESTAVMSFFDELFDKDSGNEALSGRWLLLKANPLTYFQPKHGTAASWRGARNLGAVAKFGAFDGESSNSPYIITTSDGSKAPVSRQVFYAACWDPLLTSVMGSAPSASTDLDKIDWPAFARLLLADGSPITWPTSNRVSSRDFVKRFASDLLTACLGLRNSALDGKEPIWKRAVLVEASENRHVGNEYSNVDVSNAVIALENAFADAEMAAAASPGGQP